MFMWGRGYVCARRHGSFFCGPSRGRCRAWGRSGGGSGAWRHDIAETLDVGPGGGVVEGLVDGQLEGLDDFVVVVVVVAVAVVVVVVVVVVVFPT